MALVIALDCISHRCMHCTFACHNVALLRGTRLDCLRNSASALCSVCSHPPITFLLVLQSVTVPLSVSVRWVSCVSVGRYRAPAGLVWRAASCACVLLSVGNLRRTSHAARMHATHARPPYSEDYRANILISLQGVQWFDTIKKTGI